MGDPSHGQREIFVNMGFPRSFPNRKFYFSTCRGVVGAFINILASSANNKHKHIFTCITTHGRQLFSIRLREVGGSRMGVNKNTGWVPTFQPEEI